MVICPICKRQLVRLSTHLRRAHNMFHKIHEPTSIHEFIELLKLIPVTCAEWKTVQDYNKEISKFQKTGEPLPDSILHLLHTVLYRYQSSKAPKLVVLEGCLKQRKDEES